MNYSLLILAATTFLSLSGCKQRNLDGNELKEAGAGHEGSEAFFNRFDATFSPTMVSKAVVRIMGTGSIKKSNLISDFKGWPDNEIDPLPKGGTLSYFNSTATGFIMSHDGYGLTNYHVVDECFSYGGKPFGQPTKCPGLKAILGSNFTANEFAISKLETKINNELVAVANNHIEALRKDGRSINGGVNNEVSVRLHTAVRSLVNAEEIYDVCVVSVTVSSFDAALIKFVPEGKECSDSIQSAQPFELPLADELKTLKQGTRVFSAGFGAYSRLYRQHKADSQAEFFDEMKVNFATGIVQAVTSDKIETITDKSQYKEDENFEAMDGNRGHSGSPVFINAVATKMPTLVGVHSSGSRNVRRASQTSVAIFQIKKTFFKSEECLADVRRKKGLLSSCIKSK